MLLGVLAGTLSSTMHAYHYIYLKNSLKPIQITTASGKQQQVGPATIKKAEILDSNGNPPSSDQYDSTIEPGKTSYGYSSQADTWNLTLNVDPSSSHEQGIDSSLMKPVNLQQSDDIEVIYISPTQTDPNAYYGYIIYRPGNRFDGDGDTNDATKALPVQPFVQQDGTTKFPVLAPSTSSSSSSGSSSSSSLSKSGLFSNGMSLEDAISALNTALQGSQPDSKTLKDYVKDFLQQYGAQLQSSTVPAYTNLYSVLNQQLTVLKTLNSIYSIRSIPCGFIFTQICIKRCFSSC